MAHDLFQLLSDRLNRDNLKGAQYLGVFNGAAELPTSPVPPVYIWTDGSADGEARIGFNHPLMHSMCVEEAHRAGISVSIDDPAVHLASKKVEAQLLPALEPLLKRGAANVGGAGAQTPPPQPQSSRPKMR